MFSNSHSETLLAAPAVLKKNLQFARQWTIWVESYNKKKDGLVPGLGIRVDLLIRPKIKKKICGWI